MPDNKLNRIKNIIIKECNPKRIILFGSRSKGNFSEFSDYDIAIETDKLSFRNFRKLKEKINDAIGLHSVDIVLFNDVDKKFQKIILETGKVVYEKRSKIFV
ncbi:MAG: type VII toxin-antitoxin system MntA family adenylyltransferase antitoxin [Ignavibacterium sp.]